MAIHPSPESYIVSDAEDAYEFDLKAREIDRGPWPGRLVCVSQMATLSSMLLLMSIGSAMAEPKEDHDRLDGPVIKRQK